MDFDIKKPLHIFSLLLLLGSFFIIIGLSIISLATSILYPELTTTATDIPDNLKLFVNVFTLIAQLFIFIMFMILVPILWYTFVNNLSLKEILKRLNLDFKRFDRAFLWGLLAFFFIIGLNMVLSIVLQSLGYSVDDISNVQQVADILLPIPMFIIVAFQPIGEEIFFRGFLLEKFDKIANFYGFAGDKESFIYKYKIVAVLLTSLLFGIAHLSYAKVYVFVYTTIVGFILGIAVVKTKNLYTSIIAHMLMNISTFVIYFMFKDMLGF